MSDPVFKTPKGILRASGSSSTPGSGAKASPLVRRRSVHFQPPPNLTEILQRNSPSELEEFLTHMRNQTGSSLVAWLQTLADNVSALKPKMEQFLLAVLSIPWTSQSEDVAAVFKHFLADLITAHGFYVRPVMLMLVRNLCYRGGVRSEHPPEALEAARVHDTIEEMLRVVPLAAKQALLQQAKECMPYMLTPHSQVHANYIECVFRMLTYLKEREDRVALLRVLMHRLVQLDAYIPKAADEEDDDDDDDEEEDEMFQIDSVSVAPPAHMTKAQKEVVLAKVNLDHSMVAFFSYIRDRKGRGESRELFYELLEGFETHVLCTYATGHVQYAVFYLLGLDNKLTGEFIDWLWKRFTNPNTAGVIRQSAMAYIASLTSRAKFVDLQSALAVLERTCQWIHTYLANRKSGVKRDYVDVKAHGPFYSACQGALYILAFRHSEIMEREKELLPFLTRLNFNSIVTSPLNPLRVILPPVVSEFCTVSRHFQLAYCETIIERNNRLRLPVVGGSLSSQSTGGISGCVEKAIMLDSFFPFDPYHLPASKHFVDEFYREYQGALTEGDDDDDEDDEEEEMDQDLPAQSNSVDDSFMDEMAAAGGSSLKNNGVCNALASALLGTSPGFKM